jgi:hypothetical protein
MQEVWGKILAGEVNRPGSFSLRSLKLLRNLSQQEAESFRQIVQYGIKVEDCSYIFANEACPYRQGGSMWNEALLMRELGLLSESIFFVTIPCSNETSVKLRYEEKQFEVLAKVGKADLRLNGYPLTAIGRELSRLIEVAPVTGYFDCLKADIEKKGFICRTYG